MAKSLRSKSVHGPKLNRSHRLPSSSYNLHGGKLPHFNNPNFQVREQDEPTTAHPVSQHKKFAGMGRGPK